MRYFLDTEFNGYGGNLISLALVCEDGRSVYYIVNEAHWGELDPWVKENVIPILRADPLRPQPQEPRDIAEHIAYFLKGDTDPVIISDWPADIRYFCQVIEYPMGEMAPIPRLKFEILRVDAYPSDLPGAVQHNAWWDAMALHHLVMDAPQAAA